MGPRAVWRRVVVAAFACLVALAPVRAWGASVVIVRSGDAEPYKLIEATLVSELATLGHVALTIPFDESLTGERIRELEAQGHAFLAVGSTSAIALHERLDERTLLVYCMVSDPKTRGVSLRARTCGISVQAPIAPQLKLIAEALPATRTVGMLYNSESTSSRETVDAANAVLPAGWQLKAVDIRGHRTTADAIQALFQAKPDVVWTSPDSAVFDTATIRSLLLQALRQKTPVFGYSESAVKAGALLGIGIDPRAQAIDAAALADTALKHGIPQDPTARHRPPRYDLAVNLDVAELLDVELPKAIVSRARIRFPQPPQPSP